MKMGIRPKNEALQDLESEDEESPAKKTWDGVASEARGKPGGCRLLDAKGKKTFQWGGGDSSNVAVSEVNEDWELNIEIETWKTSVTLTREFSL